jgi:hypothetical protein
MTSRIFNLRAEEISERQGHDTRAGQILIVHFLDSMVRSARLGALRD